MDQNSKRYARKILLAHVALLAVLLGVVGVAAWRTYLSARQLAIRQAGVRQELLATQTAHSIADFYISIIDDLKLLGRSDAASDAPAVALKHALTMPRQNAVEAMLWNQMSGRVAALFIYDPQAKNTNRACVILQPAADQLTSAQANRLGEDIRLLSMESQGWIDRVQEPSVSRLLAVAPDSILQKLGAGGVNLACVPVAAGDGRVLVAVVPAEAVQSQFLSGSADRQSSSTTLMDGNLAVVACTTPALVGTSLIQIDDPIVQKMTTDFITNPVEQTLPLDKPMMIAGTQLAPRLLTLEPVEFAGAKWALLISSPLSEIDTVVQDLFRVVVGWAAFLVISMTGILVSTAAQMIRVRTRMERVRHDMLTRELSQARQIQLNWLPDRLEAGAVVDLAAVNHPANHISGDFYNWFNLPDGRWVLILGDVSGHGIAAAFLMATTQLLVRNIMPRVGDAGLCMEEVNRQLCTQVFHGQFVTMLIVVLDLERGTLDAASAGQAPPLVREGDGPFVELPLKSNTVLAVDENQSYPTEHFKLSGQSTIVLYTDGVVEVKAENGDWFDTEGLIRCLGDATGPAQAMIEQVVAGVDDFRGGRELDDDLTMVVVQTQSAAVAAVEPPSAAAVEVAP